MSYILVRVNTDAEDYLQQDTILAIADTEAQLKGYAKHELKITSVQPPKTFTTEPYHEIRPTKTVILK